MRGKKAKIQRQNFETKLHESVIFDKTQLTKTQNVEMKVHVLINGWVVTIHSIGEAEANFHMLLSYFPHSQANLLWISKRFVVLDP